MSSVLTLVIWLRLLYYKQDGSLAERSKAPASGAGPKGREFESRSCHSYCVGASVLFCFWILVYRRHRNSWNVAAIAQLGERQTEDLEVPGSIPGLGTGVAFVAL